MPPLVRSRSPRVGIAVGALVVLVLLLLSHGFGRAVPTNNYRPLLTTDAIESGCYPLPGGVRLDGLAYQVRWDEDVATAQGERRHLRGQYDLVDRDEALRLLVASFRKGGFLPVDGTVDADGVTMLRDGADRVAITVTEIPGTSEETLVRGEFLLDLPVAELARPDDPICEFPSSTKRWAEPREVTR